MELVRQTSPKRTIIKCKAKIRLLADSIVGLMVMTFDDALFLDLAKTLLQADDLNQRYENQKVARDVEERFAVLLVDMYKRIKLRQQDPIVQRLNALL
jgi:hypothetical protein